MKSGLDIAEVAALIGDPARSGRHCSTPASRGAGSRALPARAPSCSRRPAAGRSPACSMFGRRMDPGAI